MGIEYFDFGDILPGTESTYLKIEKARRMLAVLLSDKSVKLLELRKISYKNVESEIIVIDITLDRIPPKNLVGIRYVERLSLRFFPTENTAPEVRALRVDFPLTLHVNHVPDNEPVSLCIYEEAWSTVARTWTPQKYLRDIYSWLERTALGTLHQEDQPVEQPFFNANWKIVLPADFFSKIRDDSHIMMFPRIEKRGDTGGTLIADIVKKAEFTPRTIKAACILINLPPKIQGPVQRIPSTLGSLNTNLSLYGVSFAELFFAEIRSQFSIQTRISEYPLDIHTIIIINFSITRTEGAVVERRYTKAFFLEESPLKIGLDSDVLFNLEGRVSAPPLVNGVIEPKNNWQTLAIDPVDIQDGLTPELARKYSGISERGPNGVIAGVGSLGSAIFNLWNRSGWGQWTLIDPDYVNAHNLVRHTTFMPLVGLFKTEALLRLEGTLWSPELRTTESIPESILDFSSPKVAAAIRSAEVIIDITTTLDYPREHARHSEFPRGLSLFITPDGGSSVLLAEDKNRSHRLDSLEAQYYRMILENNWGQNHLTGNTKSFRSGAGCRDISATISNDLISVHAGLLANKTRSVTSSSEAFIQVWNYDTETGSVLAEVGQVRNVIENALDAQTILWDEGLREKVRQWREAKLPNETGGVILGYHDLTLNKIFIVDLLSAPTDSQENPDSFIRGTVDLEQAISETERRTLGIVGYLGEWHTHPRNTSALASNDDKFLLAHLANELSKVGLPALMLIIGEYEENWYTATSRSIM